MMSKNKFWREANVRMLVNVCRGWEPVGTMAWIEGEMKLVTATTYPTLYHSVVYWYTGILVYWYTGILVY